ncbi:hypothetical protein [Haloarchaeobius sp. DFWS5]|uniref:hypothetical protein n=1 Tax=Haloarchaeobius sp. DFWS5 TaxID=3446114 RepID=UPI003EC01D30
MTLRTFAGAVGLLILVLTMTIAAPAAVDQEVSNTSNTNADEIARTSGQIGGTLASYAPTFAGLALIIGLAVAST